MNPDFLNRDVNANFSGGEKKRNEILQLSVLEVHCTSSWLQMMSPSIHGTLLENWAIPALETNLAHLLYQIILA